MTEHSTPLVIEQRTLLHVGCGQPNPDRLPRCFRQAFWREVRLDIDPGVCPDIVSSITDMSRVADRSVDAIWSSHNLEHLDSFDVPRALAEFKRVLRSDGFVLITVPDLQAVARFVAAGTLNEPLYVSQAGPISALDVIFGHQASINAGHRHMAHRTGFSATSLGNSLIEAGFDEVRVHVGGRLDLWAIGTLSGTQSSVFDELADVFQ